MTQQAKAIVNAETQKQFLVNANTATMLKEMEAAGVKMGRTSLSELLGGKREEVMGFKLVDVTINVEADTGDTQTGNQEAAGGDTNSGEATNVNAADAGAATAAPADTTQAEAAKPAPARKTIRASEPAKSGKVKPVRGGTKIAKGLELLLKGAKLAELEAADLSDDLPDFCNRRITKRGYGVSITGEGADTSYKLRLPAGVDKIAYSAGGPADEDEKPAAEAASTTEAATATETSTAEVKPADDTAQA